jgi:hypothetical protein
MSDEFTRRNLLRATAATAAGFGATGTVAGDGVGTDADPEVTGRIPCRTFDVVDLTTVSASEPLPDQATGIQPGSQMFIEYPDGTTAGCTANFIWRDTSGPGDGDSEDSEDSEDPADPDDPNDRGLSAEDGGSDDAGGPAGSDDLYIGAAGHCFIDGDATADDNAGGPDEKTYDVSKLTVKVCKDCNVGGLTGLAVPRGEVYELGEVEYARQVRPAEDGTEGDEVGHDFGVVRIPDELRPAVDPSMPQFGGPIDVQDGAVPAGETVAQYGAGVANGEVFPTMATRGVSEGDLGSPKSWYAALRASPGDSGSPLVEYEFGSGTDATGVLTHLTTVGVAGTTVTRCIEMPKRDDVDLDLEVVRANEDVTR